MKKLMVVFVAIMFLATFTLIGCNQSQESPKPAAEKGAPGAPGAPGTPAPAAEKGEPRSTWCPRSTRSARSTRSTRSTCASTRKIVTLDIGVYPRERICPKPILSLSTLLFPLILPLFYFILISSKSKVLSNKWGNVFS